jgi:hypothetical protein
MFEFIDLDGLSRVILLKKQKETVDYWRTTFRLKGAFIVWESQTIDLIRQYKANGGVSDLTKSLDSVCIKGELTIKRLENHIKRINDYLADLDTRLGDGTRWYNAIEIQEMYASIEGVSDETPNA